MSWLTIALLAFLGFGLLRGVRRGLVAVAAGIAGYLLGLILARRYQGRLTRLAERHLPIGHWVQSVVPLGGAAEPAVAASARALADSLLSLLVFLAILCVTESVLRLVGAAITGIVRRIILVRSVNSLGGAVGGLVENAVIAGVVLGLLVAVPFAAHSPLVHAVRGTPLADDLVRWVSSTVNWPIRRWIA